jgi:hypothetical protein
MHSTFPRFWDYTVAVLVAAACFVPHLMAAGPSAAPEIDGSMITAGVGVLAAGVLIIRARRK